MTDEIWKDVPGFEGRYQVSNLGRVKSLSFMQRYLLRNGAEAYRRTAERIVSQQKINSGYLIVHLHLDNARKAVTVHRLVAEAFLPAPAGETVNHIDGVKTNNVASNLEWSSYTDNHLHAVDLQLNTQAIPVVSPFTGRRYPSISQAEAVHGKQAREWPRA